MDDKTWYLGLATLGAAVLGMLLDASLSGFNLDPGYYPFLGIFAGGFFGIAAAAKLRRDRNNKDEEDKK